jgi:hypothetical protein
MRDINRVLFDRCRIAGGALALAGLLCCFSASAADLKWAGTTWQVRSGGGRPCASGHWNAQGAWVDADGWLHLKLAPDAQGRFECVEVKSVERFGFGHYEFDVQGPVGSIDPNVVLGIFMYPPPEVGPDGTNEIDIEVSRWGRADAPQINYTVWNRTRAGKRHTNLAIANGIRQARCGFTWQPERVSWESPLHPGPVAFAGDIADQPQHLILNLWLYRETAPSDGREVEFMVKWRERQ